MHSYTQIEYKSHPIFDELELTKPEKRLIKLERMIDLIKSSTTSSTELKDLLPTANDFRKFGKKNPALLQPLLASHVFDVILASDLSFEFLAWFAELENKYLLPSDKVEDALRKQKILVSSRELVNLCAINPSFASEIVYCSPKEYEKQFSNAKDLATLLEASRKVGNILSLIFNIACSGSLDLYKMICKSAKQFASYPSEHIERFICRGAYNQNGKSILELLKADSDKHLVFLAHYGILCSASMNCFGTDDILKLTTSVDDLLAIEENISKNKSLPKYYTPPNEYRDSLIRGLCYHQHIFVKKLPIIFYDLAQMSRFLSKSVIFANIFLENDDAYFLDKLYTELEKATLNERLDFVENNLPFIQTQLSTGHAKRLAKVFSGKDFTEFAKVAPFEAWRLIKADKDDLPSLFQSQSIMLELYQAKPGIKAKIEEKQLKVMFSYSPQ